MASYFHTQQGKTIELYPLSNRSTKPQDASTFPGSKNPLTKIFVWTTYARGFYRGDSFRRITTITSVCFGCCITVLRDEADADADDDDDDDDVDDDDLSLLTSHD